MRGTSRTDRQTVLMVEDESLIRADTADVLAEQGLDVVEAVDAEEAIGILAERADISVLFTDVNLPGMSGIELARLVQRCWPHIRVIVTSSLAIGHDAAMPGMFIGKPYRPEAVAAAVRDLAEARRYL